MIFLRVTGTYNFSMPRFPRKRRANIHEPDGPVTVSVTKKTRKNVQNIEHSFALYI